MLFVPSANEILFLGLNKLTMHIAKKLSSAYNVTIIANKPSSLEDYYQEEVAIKASQRNLLRTLKEEKIELKDYFLAFTENDEYNIYAAKLAKTLGVGKAAALNYTNDYLELEKGIELIINPYQIIIDQLSTWVRDSRVLKISNLIPGKVNLSQIRVKKGDAFTYAKIKNIHLEQGLLVAVKRDKRMILPEEDLQILPGDILYFLFKKGRLNKILKIFKKYTPKNRLFIFGGNELARNLIASWENIFEPKIIIEPDLNQCHQLAELLNGVLVLNGEGTDLQLLLDEGLDEQSVFLALSEDDQANLLSSFAVKSTGCSRVITLLNRSRYDNISSLLKLDNVLILPDLIGDYLLSFLKSGWKLDKYILGNEVYTAEIVLKRRSLVGRKIKSLNLPQGIIIGLINRDEKVIIPSSEERLKWEDGLVIFFYRQLEARVQHIFQKGP